MMNVTIENFDDEVVAASMQVPVLVDFWAPWCGPCKVIGPLLEKIETAYAGRFKLVKIDSDEQQELSQAFGIRSIPTCVLMYQGKPVDGFTGALTEGKIKEFLDKHLPEGDVLEAEVTSVEVNDAPPADDPDTVREALHQAMLQAPQDDNARFDYIKLLLMEGKTDDAKVAFAPVIAQTSIVRRYNSLQRWMLLILQLLTQTQRALSPNLMQKLRPTSGILIPALPALKCSFLSSVGPPPWTNCLTF
jgi:putative thioredoxin